jgi:ectoine hydroxylase-related dioxygenase (phytanoyl-CoA dioxygenase family)
MTGISDAQIEEFQANGVVLLKGAFADYVEAARAAIAQNQANPSWRERTYRPEDGSAPFFQDYVVWDQFDGYRDLVRASPMAEMAAALMQSKTARIFHDHILVKEPGNSVVTPWHQDQPYYLVEGRQSVSFWVPLDPVPRDRVIEYVKGSHLWGTDFKPMRFDGTALFEGDASEAVPDVEANREALDILGWGVEPGDAVAFTFRTLHGAPANASPTRRRVISLRWVGDDAVFADRLGATSPAFPDLEYTPGEAFEGGEFPVIYDAGTDGSRV